MDRAKGSRLDYRAWLQPMEGQVRGFESRAGKPTRGKKRANANFRADGRMWFEWALISVERDFDLWKQTFLAEANLVARFLGLLADLQLDVTPELEELKSLKAKDDFVLHHMNAFIQNAKAATSSETSLESREFPDLYHELLAVAESLEGLKARVIERAEDAVRLVSLMTPLVDSQTLIDLFTGEP